MKNFIQELFKKGRRREKQIFLFSNIVIFILVMGLVWGSYNPDDNTITFPPSVGVSASDIGSKPTDTTDQTENTTNSTEGITTDPTESTTQPPTETTEPTESKDEWPKYHTVVKGDTWYNLSIRYFKTDEYADALAYINDRRITDYIFIGETLTIGSESYLIQIAGAIKNDDFSENYHFFEAGPFGYKYGERSNPAIDITVSKDCTGKNYTEEVDTSTFEYVGKHVITGYDPHCTHCCKGTGLMASGNYAINGYSIAASYPLGTTLYIEGYGFYMVEDRGVSGKHIDIAAPSHQDCYALTSNSVAVYIVPNNN